MKTIIISVILSTFINGYLIKKSFEVAAVETKRMLDGVYKILDKVIEKI